MFGGEAGGPYPARGQYHPATAHWRGGWLRVRHEQPIDATASAGALTVRPRGSGTATIIVSGDPSGAVEATADGSSVELRADGKVKLDGVTEFVVRARG